jgi:alginate O-acetyltransferase complex protein AlgI
VDLSGLLMSLELILLLSLASIITSTIRSGRIRSFLLFCFSLIALYSLQPALSLRSFDYWLPTMAIALSVWVWMATQDRQKGLGKEELVSLVLLCVFVIAMAASSYLPKELRWFVSLPVNWFDALGFLLFIMLVAWGIRRIKKHTRIVDGILLIVIVALFIGLKTPAITLELARLARQVTGQSMDLANVFDLNWIGFSYISFRLLHVLRDYRSGRLPDMGVQDFLLYVFFFPALSAGPIDRVERFLKDLHQDRVVSRWEQWQKGGIRILLGLFKKFVLADSLALIAMSSNHIDLVHSIGWLWILLYAYSLQIYLDFCGYTDIAIGIGVLSGIQLPENFNQPYLQTNIGAFWNRWHITLAQWFRAYVFNPLTRALRQGSFARYAWFIILIGQMTTMVLIGLWHGVTWNFVVWGAWHGLGLFIHNRWTDFQRRKKIDKLGGAVFSRARALIGGILTFNFVSLGWVWFSTPDLQSAWMAFIRLMGGSVG